MKHSLTRLPKSSVEVVISLEKNEFEPIKTEILKKVSKDAEIPGFRKGKAPEDKILAHHKEGITNEIESNIINKYFDEISKKEEIIPISYARNVKTDMESENCTITFEIDIYPTVELGEYKGISAKKEEFKFSEDMIDEEMKYLVESKKELIDAEKDHKAEMGDTVDLAFEGFVDDVPFEGGKAESHLLALGSKSFIDNFEEQLVGYTVGQEGEVNVKFPEEYNSPELAGKMAKFKVKINGIKNSKLPELNDEFAKELGFESLEDMKTKKREEIINNEEQKLEDMFISDLLRKSVENSKVEIPESMLEAEAENRVKEVEQRLSMQGVGLDMYLQMMGTDFENFKKQMYPIAEERVKNDLILTEIAKVEDINISDEELEEKINEVAEMYNMSREQLEGELNKNNNLDYFKSSLRSDVTKQKAIAIIMEHSK